MHTLIAWLADHFLPVWKPVSIALTGAFGVLGLLTEFKDKHTKRITKWGRISLTGIVVSTMLGVGAQLKESHDDTKKTMEAVDRSEKTLKNIERTLSAINEPKVLARFAVDCTSAAYRSYCDELTKDRDDPYHWSKHWPLGSTDTINFQFLIFLDSNEATEWAKGIARGYPWGDRHPNSDGDLDIDSDFTPLRDLTTYGKKGFYGFQSDGHTSLHMSDESPLIQGTGKFRSMMDFPGSTLLVYNQLDRFRDLTPTDVRITNKDGEAILADGPFERKTTRDGMNREIVIYRYVFPKTN
jgi:hypothetical protein